MSFDEGLSAVKFCLHLLGDVETYPAIAAAANASGDSHKEVGEVRGHFYTNDVKVLVEVCLRELTNIPVDEYPRLRMG